MKALAKRDMGYPEYPYTNWIQGNKYAYTYYEDRFQTDVVDEQGVTFHFCGRPEDLIATNSFDFVGD
jgi:membrane-bound lytic murein transglycosylase